MSGIRSGRRRDRAAFQPVIMPALDVPKGSEEFDTRTERALADLADAVNALGSAATFAADVDLAVGTNIIAHGLGRLPSLVTVAPTAANVNFGWGWDPKQPGNSTPSTTVHVTVAGTAMTARVIVE